MKRKKIVVYHGSDHLIEAPVFGFGTPRNDYGRGYYCTCDLELAKEWACRQGTDGIVSRYELEVETSNLIVKELDDSDARQWLAVLMANRRFVLEDEEDEWLKGAFVRRYAPDLSKVDVVVGYRADDSYFSFAKGFAENSISLEKVQVFLRLGGLGKQVVLLSKKAFGAILYLGCEKVPAHPYFEKSKIRDEEARRRFRLERKAMLDARMKAGGKLPRETFIRDIMADLIAGKEDGSGKEGGNDDEPSL